MELLHFPGTIPENALDARIYLPARVQAIANPFVEQIHDVGVLDRGVDPAMDQFRPPEGADTGEAVRPHGTELIEQVQIVQRAVICRC